MARNPARPKGVCGMAELTHKEQVEVVRKALALETAIKVERANVELIKSQQFDRLPLYTDLFNEAPPSEPRRRLCEAPTPIEAVVPEPPKTNYSMTEHLKANPLWAILLITALIFSFVDSVFGMGLGLLSGIAWIASVIGFFRSFLSEKKRRNQELASSPEYLNAVALAQQEAANAQAQAELQAQQEQARLDAEYEAAVEHYHDVLLPAYEQTRAENQTEYNEILQEYSLDKRAWESKRQEAIAALERDMAANQAALEKLYDSSKIISLHYREIPILEWLYDDMRTSDHDIRYATELLDRDRQRIATEEAGARTVRAVDRLRGDVTFLQGVQIQGLRNLEAVAGDILYTTEDIYTSSKKMLFHQRVNTVDIGLREWRRHKAKKANK